MQVVEGTQSIPEEVTTADTYAYAKQNHLPHVGVAWVNEEALDQSGSINCLLNANDHNAGYNYYSAHGNETGPKSIAGLQSGDAVVNGGSLSRLEPVLGRVLHYAALDGLSGLTTRTVWIDEPKDGPRGDRLWLYLACQILLHKTGILAHRMFGFNPFDDHHQMNLSAVTGGPFRCLTTLRVTSRLFNTEVSKFYFSRVAFAFHEPTQLARFLCGMEGRFEMLQEPAVVLNTIIISMRRASRVSYLRMAVAKDFGDMPGTCSENEWTEYLNKLEYFTHRSDSAFSSSEETFSAPLGWAQQRVLHVDEDEDGNDAHDNDDDDDDSGGEEEDEDDDFAVHGFHPHCLPEPSVNSDWLIPLQLLLQRYKVRTLVLKGTSGAKLQYGDDSTFTRLRTMLGPNLTKSLYVFEDVGGWNAEE